MINGEFPEESEDADHSALGQLVGQRAEFVRCNGRLGTRGQEPGACEAVETVEGHPGTSGREDGGATWLVS